MGKEEMEASMDPCLYFCFPLSTRGQGGAQQACDSQFSRLTQSVAWLWLLSCPCRPPSGVWGLCPFCFSSVLPRRYMLWIRTLPPAGPARHGLLPSSECHSPSLTSMSLTLSSYLLHSLNIKPNSASRQVIWWQWWTLGCLMVLNFSKLFAFFTSIAFSWKGSPVGEIMWR